MAKVAVNPRRVRRPKDESEAAFRERTRRAAYYRVFDSPAGREVLADILRGAGWWRAEAADADSPGTLAFNAGMRRICLHILDSITDRREFVETCLMTGEIEGLFNAQAD